MFHTLTYRHNFSGPVFAGTSGPAPASQHARTGEFSTHYKFNGKEPDPETGWYYYGARYYDPALSRWPSTDLLTEQYPAFAPYNYMLSDVDFRYLNTDGVSFQSGNAFRKKHFSILNNQRVYDTATKLGFTKNHQGSRDSLNGVKKFRGHNDHARLGLQYKSLDWKYVTFAPTRQLNSDVHWFNQ